MANSWLRLWHDMPNDPKWRTIARVSGQPIALVQAVYLQLLVSASQNPVTDESGVTLHVTTVTKEDIASSLDVTEAEVESVTLAMQGRVLDGLIISGWERRQSQSFNYKNPGKLALTGAERAKRCRERKKLLTDTERNVTSGNVTQRDGNGVTEQIRIDKKRIEKELKDKTLLSHGENNATGPNENNLPPNREPEGQEAEAENKRHEYSPEFEAAWLIYPRRPGSPDKHGAFKAWNARLRDGVTTDAMLEGVRRYAEFVKATGKAGTEFIKQAKTFFGPSKHFDDEWQVSTGENHVEFRFNQSDPRPYSEQYLSWEQQQGIAGMEPMGSHDQNLREPLDCEEWQSPV
ncbi:TPA: hypothetical protein ACPZF7_000932 [Yersinia enterocolitica]